MTHPDETTRGKLLVVLMDGHRVATLVEGDGGRLQLTYDEQWRASATATPLSLSMPLTRAEHGEPATRAFVWGLLPESESVLERWAREFQVSARNPFALLRHVGEDCAGAAQFVRPERVEALRAGDGGVEWLADAAVADRVRALRRDPTAWHAAGTGQFSLAGAQAKTALYYDAATGAWGDPWGAVPTTHILKPGVYGLDDHDLNEHLCLELGQLLGLPAVRSEVCSFAGERVIVVERYDRLPRHDGSIGRVHQEDMCQALAVPPTNKYQNEGGPSPERLVTLLRESVTPPAAAMQYVRVLIDALAFNWIIGGTDAHASNYAVLLAGKQVRLAPLYDVASALPYDFHQPKLKMAMRVGGEYRLAAISGRRWRRLASAAGVDPDATVARIRDLLERVPDALATVVHGEPVRALGSDLPGKLLDQVSSRARSCRAALDR